VSLRADRRHAGARSRRPRLRLVLAGAALAGAVSTAGCGIPLDDAPRAVQRDNPPGTGAIGTATTAPAVAAPWRIYLVQVLDEGPRLVTVDREVAVESQGAPPSPAAVLETVLNATAEPDEQQRGIANPIPSSTRLASTPRLVGGRLAIDLTEGIYELQGDVQLAAFGQIVCTAATLEGVDTVWFEVDGERRAVPAGAGGATTDDPVSCEDYEHLQP
jgi:hypothetical protein